MICHALAQSRLLLGGPTAKSLARFETELAGLDQVAGATDLLAFRQAVEAELTSQTVGDDRGVATPASEGDGSGPPDRGDLPGPVSSGVFVGSPSEARGLSFCRVYVLGMADQFLPGAIQGTSLLPESQLDDAEW